jgi:hypothetical protein
VLSACTVSLLLWHFASSDILNYQIGKMAEG